MAIKIFYLHFETFFIERDYSSTFLKLQIMGAMEAI